MIAKRLVLAVLLAPALHRAACAQSAGDLFNRAPAGVEDALRDRVTKFYALQTEGKFRQSEALVCEESRDAFYDSDKRRWSSLEIIKISFEDNFRVARATVALGTELSTRAGKIPAKYPYTSHWHLEKDQWCYFLPPPSKEETITPFGTMRQGEAGKANAGTPIPPRPDASLVLSSVKLSKTDLRVKGYEKSSDELEVYNGMPGQLTLDVQAAQVPGIDWKLGKKILGAGERTTLRVDYTPPDKSPKPAFTLQLMMEPIGQAQPITITFDIPEEVKRQLPPELRK